MAAGDYAPTGHGLLLGQALRPAVSAFNVMLACIILFDICKFPFIFLLFYVANIQQFMEKVLRVSQFFSAVEGKISQ